MASKRKANGTRARAKRARTRRTPSRSPSPEVPEPAAAPSQSSSHRTCDKAEEGVLREDAEVIEVVSSDSESEPEDEESQLSKCFIVSISIYVQNQA